MLAIDLAITVLLSFAFILSVIELGISVHVVTISYVEVPVVYGTRPDGTLYPGPAVVWRQWYPPGEVSYLVFCSVWTILAAPIVLAIPLIRKKFSDRFLGLTTFILNTLTMIFWFAGFIALACWYQGVSATGIYGALLAFPVMLWLVYLALTVLNFLTGFGVARSARRGQHPIFQKKRRTASTASTIAPEQPAAPVKTEEYIHSGIPIHSETRPVSEAPTYYSHVSNNSEKPNEPYGA